jgi:surface protein
MEESSRDSYQKLGDPGEEENNNTEKKCNKKLIIIIGVVLALVVAGVVVTIILLSSSSPSPSPEKKCPDGQYLPSDDKSECYNCTSNCKQCTGTKTESQCTACYDGYSLDGDICVGLFSFKGEYTTQANLEKVYFFNDAFTGNIENMTIDGIETDPASYHEFDKPGNHKVYFNLKSDNMISKLNSLFSGRSQLSSIVFSEDFDSTNVTTINSMFYDCNSLTSVDLRHFITTNVDDMNDLFFSCHELNYVDISKFSTNIDNVTLFDKILPVNGSISLTKDFHEKIKGQFPDSWIVNETENDIYDLLEN